MQRCIVCKTKFIQSHDFYSALCVKCGDLNYRKRQETADLQGMTALVTGARIKIGYAVTLRLLRAGAKVIATTRFPNNAATKYAAEPDFSEWKHQLQIYGLDLRNLATVEQFAQHIRHFYPRLDIIINNAAQTIRRPSAFYRHLIPLENLTPKELSGEIKTLLAQDLNLRETTLEIQKIPLISGEVEEDGELFPLGEKEEEMMDLRPFNSWLMKDDEVSILELLEVHVINAIAPFIINSRLKQLMSQEQQTSKYIINVSSMEGRFNGVDKPWRHPHTNMAKAALNQMTRTCAKEYAKYKIFMNGVDPGWISFQHPYPQAKTMMERGVKPPFDVIDAAARICDPIYVGLNQNFHPLGKLFKDYFETNW